MLLAAKTREGTRRNPQLPYRTKNRHGARWNNGTIPHLPSFCFLYYNHLLRRSLLNMVKGIGVDIIEVARIKKMVENDRPFLEKVFTESEIRYCGSKYRQGEHFAARFAAKEAFFKAMGTGWRGGMAWTDICVENDDLGKPGIKLTGKTLAKFQENQFRTIFLSVSHTKDYAAAFVVIEG